MTSSLVEVFRKKFGPVPLLQSGHLPKSAEIPNPEGLDPKELSRLHQMGRTLIQAFQNFVAVAYTEFPPEAYKFFGIDPQHQRVIYLSHLISTRESTPSVVKNDFVPLSGSLLINPEVQVPRRATRFIKIEGCGSIENAKLNMFVSRPTIVTLNTHVYNPDLGYQKPTPVKNIHNSEASSAIIEHEYHHLQGYDATNAPGVELLDPWHGFNSPAWKDHSQEVWLYIARGYLTGTDKNWLVRREGQLTVVNPEGQFIRRFTR